MPLNRMRGSRRKNQREVKGLRRGIYLIRIGQKVCFPPPNLAQNKDDGSICALMGNGVLVGGNGHVPQMLPTGVNKLDFGVGEDV